MEHNRVVYTRPYDAEVEYLESDGNSYIDTGLKASSKLGILAHIQFNNVDKWAFGGGNGYADKELGFHFVGGNSTYRYGNQVIPGGVSLRTKYEFDNTQNHNVMKVGNVTYTANNSVFTSDSNLYLFHFNRLNTPLKSNSNVRIYDFKIYDNSTLVRDFIPVRIGQIGYMYDKVSKQLFANKGTGNFILGPDVANPVPNIRRVFRFDNKRFVMPMPYDSKIEYLESTGTQWINTLINFKPYLYITFNALYTGNFNKTQVLASASSSGGCWIGNVPNMKWGINSGGIGNSSIKTNVSIYYDDSITKLYINNTQSVQQQRNIYPTKPITIFGSYNAAFGSSAKLYSISIIDNINSNDETLIFDAIPVRRGNVGYLYDKVSGKLFANAGTGQFILGNDIND